jgi:hypothetical protein
MNSKPDIYISHDDFARGRHLERRLRELLPDYLRSRFITFGHGELTAGTNRWSPSEYGLAIFILSGPPTAGRWDSDGYRIQSELQEIEEARIRQDKELPNTLMFIERGVDEWVRRGDVIAGRGSVVTNIVNLGQNWIEYENDFELEKLLKNEIVYFQERLPELSERTDGSWRITLERAIQSKIGAKWLERGDHFHIDTSGTESDNSVAREPLTAQLHGEIKRKAREFLPIAERLSNSLGWERIASATCRYLKAIDIETEELPRNLGLAYDAMLELASFFEQDAELQQQPDSNALPLDPEVRRPLRLLIRAAAPWLRRFPTVRELDDECGAFLSRPDLLEPAASVLEIARVKRLVSDTDAAATQGVLVAAHRGKFQGDKAGTRGIHTVRNLVIASAAAIGTFLSGAVASDFATKSDLIKHAGSTLAEASEYIEKLTIELQDDIKIALREIIKEINRRKIF